MTKTLLVVKTLDITGLLYQVVNMYPTSEQYRSANETNIDEQILNLKATLLRGNHTISVGYDMHEKFVSNLFIAFENGRFRWNSVDDFLNGNLSYLRFIKPVTETHGWSCNCRYRYVNFLY